MPKPMNSSSCCLRAYFLVALVFICCIVAFNVSYFLPFKRERLKNWNIRYEKKSMLNSRFIHNKTIVTAYYQIESKHSHAEYLTWMRNFLSLADPMVIFTSNSSYETIRKFRAHAPERTSIIVDDLNDSFMARKYDKQFWEIQFEKDPEKGVHRSYHVYWIWLAKIDYMKRAQQVNPFGSSFFAWVDIGYLRSSDYNGMEMLNHVPDTLLSDQILCLQICPTCGGVGGGFIGGYEEGIRRYHDAFYSLINVHKNEFIGKDQPWMFRVCKETCGLCLFVESKAGFGDPWFFMAPLLIYGQTATNASIYEPFPCKARELTL